MLDPAQFYFAEIQGRSPGFFQTGKIPVPRKARLVKEVAGEIARVTAATFAVEALVDEICARHESHLESSDETASENGLTRGVYKALADTILTRNGLIEWGGSASSSLAAKDVFAGYEEISIGSNRSFYRCERPGIPLLIVNAMGIPWTPWLPLLGDREISVRPMFWQSPCSELFTPGIQSACGIEELVEDFAANVARLINGKFHVLGWCNGGRLAVALAEKYPDLVESLVLLSVSFKNMPGLTAGPSEHEDNMHRLYRAARSSPAATQAVVALLRNTGKLPDFSEWSRDEPRRSRLAEQMLGLPDQAMAEILGAPWSSAPSFERYAELNERQERFALGQALAGVQAPIHWLSGSHDNIVNNRQVEEGLGLTGASFRFYELFGANHFWHAQQYPYFRGILEGILGLRPPMTSCRLQTGMQI